MRLRIFVGRGDAVTKRRCAAIQEGLSNFAEASYVCRHVLVTY
jgi:hypothetical protein